MRVAIERAVTERSPTDADRWRVELGVCPATSAVRLERPRLETGEPWCVTRLAGLQFYGYGEPGLDGAPLWPDAGERLNLVRRPDNPVDGNAVEVC